MGQQLVKSSINDKNFKLVSLTENRIIKKVHGIQLKQNTIDAFRKTNVIIDFGSKCISGIKDCYNFK